MRRCYMANYCLSWERQKTKNQFFNGAMLPFVQSAVQKNASRISMSRIENRGMELLRWPTLNADLNPEILRRKVYDREKPAIENIVELKIWIKSAWADIQNEALNKLVDNMPEGSIKVIKNEEKSTKYRMKR